MPDKQANWWLHSTDTLRQGIGVVLHWKPTGWVVNRVIANSPAADAGVEAGDQVLSINGYELGAKEDLREIERESAIKTAEGAPQKWQLRLVRSNTGQEIESATDTLRNLIEKESSETLHDYCYSCYECYMETNGWANCGKSGCSNKCIVT